MCKNIDGATSDCRFKIHDMKCPKGHPLHLSSRCTFMVCRSGCDYLIFVYKEDLSKVNAQIRGKQKSRRIN